MQLCNRIYYSKVFWRLNMFRAAHRSSSGALNCICNLWFICPYGDRLLPRLSGKWISHSGCKYSLELLMMSGVPLETCWAFKKLWNTKFYYKSASCWHFYWVIYDERIHEYQNLAHFFLEREMCQTKVVEKIKTNTLSSATFCEKNVPFKR